MRIRKLFCSCTMTLYYGDNDQSITAAYNQFGKARIIDVALDFAFDSHEGFTRAFTSCIGISPKKYATTGFPECGRIVARYLNRSNSISEVQDMNTTIAIFTQIIERPARKLLLKRSIAADDYFSYVAEVGCGKQNNSALWAGAGILNYVQCGS